MSKSPSSKKVTFEGGAIRNPKKKEPERDEKIMQALATSVGGAIRNPKKKEPERDEKIMQALATSVGGSNRKKSNRKKGGSIKFHDSAHKYLYQKLSGRGGRLDSAMCRKMMHNIMSKYDPTLFQSYLRGKVMDHPRFHSDHPIQTPKPKQDAHADVIDHGGSLNNITHSEDGILRSHDAEFHHFFEIV